LLGGIMSLRCLITAGPTREFFDPVRYISNPSSGKMGYAIAGAAVAAGWSVDLVSGPVSLPEPDDVILYPVVTGAEMFEQVDALFGPCDILIKTAAVCDFRPKLRSAGKIKKDAVSLVAEFEPVRDILKAMGERRKPGQTLVGFAAETNDIETYALKKLEEKHLDLVVANRVGGGRGTNAFESDDNTVVLLGRDGLRKTFGPAPKTDVAKWLIAEIAAYHATKNK
jgi:phosphopantothenoylcysteine decarboxylase/phosphopantothenate--cysteine ligase